MIFFSYRNGYSGDACGDAIVALCCTCCASIQIANELDQMENGGIRNDQAPIVTTQVTINQAPIVQAPIVQVQTYGQVPSAPPPYM